MSNAVEGQFSLSNGSTLELLAAVHHRTFEFESEPECAEFLRSHGITVFCQLVGNGAVSGTRPGIGSGPVPAHRPQRRHHLRAASA